MEGNTSRGLGLCDVLTIVFLVLKLVGVIDWSWWWVFSPTLIALGLYVVVFVVAAIISKD
nr:MAG TPA: transmembrane protein [Caudoviricetes sp.]